MSPDEIHEIAARCMEAMETMAAMMGGHGESGAMPMGGGAGALMGMAGGVWLIVVVVLLLFGAVLLGALLGRRQSRRADSRGRAAVDELDLRYVRGEVDRDSYLQIRQDLNAGRG